MYGGDLGAGGGGNWKAPDDPSLVVGGKDDVSMTPLFCDNYDNEMYSPNNVKSYSKQSHQKGL